MSYVELLFCKSKAYLHPSSSKKDNVVGFVTLLRPIGLTVNGEVLLSFTPESMLTKSELLIYQDIDLDNEIVGQLLVLLLQNKRPAEQSKKPKVLKPSSGSTYGFSIPISHIFSVQLRNPSVGWWFGSMVVNTRGNEKLPVVFFHDDESPLTVRKQKAKNLSFDPFGPEGLVYWGGQDVIAAMEKLIHIEQSSVESSMYLVDPSSADLRNFSPLASKSKNAEPSASSSVLESLKLPDVNKMIATAKWKVLETVATFGLRTKHQVTEIVDDNVPQFIVRHVMNKPEVQKVSDDFESARVYLAKWAAQVKEEAEQAQRKFMMEDAVYARINKELGTDAQLLTPEEMSMAQRRKPVGLVEWEGFFNGEGRLLLTVSEVKSRIFHGGLRPEVRKYAWPFLLGVYSWTSSANQRKFELEKLQGSYAEMKRSWTEDEDKRSTDFWKDQKVRIEKDIHRNDRSLDIFKSTSDDKKNSLPDDGDDDWDLANITNIHLYRMREILLTFNEYNKNLGYVQGMTDLLSPLYVTFQNETMAFWCFTHYMERMERNFLRDQSGMKLQMVLLNELVQFMLPGLYRHLDRCELTDLFFFFRMLLVWFKREFEWDDVNTLWEVLWTDYYLSQFHLFVALAVLSDNERIIKQNLRRFDEVLKYMNELLGKLKLHDLLVRSELLFLRFRRMISLIDRENNAKPSDQQFTAKVSPVLRQLLSKELVIQKEAEREEGMGGG